MATWLFEIDTLKFLRVNEAAVRQYGYSHEEFAQMTTMDIRPESEHEKAKEYIRNMSVTLVYPSRRLLSATVRSFVDFISAKFPHPERDPWLEV